MRNFKLLIEITQVYIRTRHRRDKGKYDCPLSLFGTEELGAGSLRGTTQFTPEVDFPGCVKEQLGTIERRVDSGVFKRARPGAFACPLSSIGRSCAYLWKERGPCSAIPADELFHLCSSDLYVLVLSQGSLDKVV